MDFGNAKDDRKPYSLGICYARTRLTRGRRSDDPKDDRQHCYYSITRSLIDKGERSKKDKRRQKTLFLAFVVPGLVLTRGQRRGWSRRRQTTLLSLYFFTSSCIDKGEGVSNTKDDRKPYYLDIHYARARLYQETKEVMTPKTTDNLVTILSLGLLSTREKGVSNTKDEGKSYSLGICYARTRLTRGRRRWRPQRWQTTLLLFYH